MEYDKLEPFGPARDDYRIALLGMQLARIFGAKDTTIDQFVLSFDDDEELVGARNNAMEEKAAWLTALFGGRDGRQTGGHPGVPR